MNYTRPKNFILFAVIFLIMSGFILISCFPNKQSGDQKDEKKYLAFRAEGYPLSKDVLSGFKYFKKYLNKRIIAPDSIIDYFKNQADLCKSLTQINDEQSKLSLSFVGDIMWIRNNWEDFLSKEVKSYLEGNDMVFGNLETPIDPQKIVPRILPDYFSYNSSPELIFSFNRADGTGNLFTALSIANNHAFDKGKEGLERTGEFLQNNRIKFSGVTFEESFAGEYLKFSKNGINVGFYAASWGLNNPKNLLLRDIKINYIPGIAPLDVNKIDLSGLVAILRKMEHDSIDIKILNLHWGYEYELYPDPEIMKIARRLTIEGADIIIGSHPHVLQPNEVCLINGYANLLNPVIGESSEFCFLSDSSGIPRKSLIIYSLGNFVTAMFTPLCRLGVIQSVNLYTNPLTGRIDWTLPEFRFVYNTPSDPENNSRKLMFWDEFINKLEQKSPSKAENIKKETAIIFNKFY